MGIILKFLLLRGLRVLISHSEQLISEKIFFGLLITIWTPVLFSFPSLTTWHFCSILCSTCTCHSKFLYSSVYYSFTQLCRTIFTELSVVFVPWCILYKRNTYEHSLFSRMHFWHALTSRSPWLVHTWTSTSCSTTGKVAMVGWFGQLVAQLASFLVCLLACLLTCFLASCPMFQH